MELPFEVASATDALLAALREKGIITERPDDSGAFVLKS